MARYLIFDSGPIISLSMNGMLYILEELKKNFDGEFIITPQVKNEVVDKPLKIKKFEFEAVRVAYLIEKGILKLSSSIVPNDKLNEETARIKNQVNSQFYSDNKNIELIQEGEAACLALANLCNCKNLLVVDERTTRLLVESPESLKKIMENKLHTRIKTRGNFEFLKNIQVIRTAELLFIAYKKNLLGLKKDKLTLDSILYASKFKGTAISTKEIEEIKKLV
jgi:predicted nucleic acid-binding protein